MAFLSLLKTKIAAVGIGILAVLLGVIKYLSHRNTTLKNEVNIANKQLKFKENVDKVEAEIEQDFSHRAAEARRDLENDEIPDHLRNPRD
jgi:hypothetical protein